MSGVECYLCRMKPTQLLPDYRNQMLVVHSYEDMVCQRVGQIMCGYEDANDCDRLRHDSVLKMSVGRKPSDIDLCSQPTMTRLENHIDKRTLIEIGKLFVKETTAFAGTEVEDFTMDSFMKRIMLSAVFIVEKKTFVRFSFSPHHRHLGVLTQALERLSA